MIKTTTKLPASAENIPLTILSCQTVFKYVKPAHPGSRITGGGVSILDSALLVIPAGSESSYGYSPAAVIADVILADNAKMEIDIVGAGGSGSGDVLGLEVTLLGYVILATS